MLSALKVSGYFECQGSNSLNFGPIFKILVAKYISVSRPFIWCAEHPRGMWPRAQKRVKKLVLEKWTSQKLKKMTYQLKVSKLWVEILIYIDNLTSWAKKKISSNLRTHGDIWTQRLDLSWTISDLSFDLRVSRVLHFKRIVCTDILRCCKPKSDKKCRSYVTLKHPRV